MLEQIGIGLVCLIIGGIGARALQALQAWNQNRHIDRFWRNVLDESTTIIYGDFKKTLLGMWDPAGLMGIGDSLALAEVLRRLRRKSSVLLKVYPCSRTTPQLYKNNLILIGGPSGNSVTASIFKKINAPLIFPGAEENIVLIKDRISDHEFVPNLHRTGKEGHDFGLITCCINPFYQSKSIVILAGSFGFGTWAAAMWACNPESWRAVDSKIKGLKEFQILIRTDVVDGFPASNDLVLIQEFNPRKTN